MNAVHAIRATLHEALNLASKRHFDEALRRIEDGLRQATLESSNRLIVLLARNGGVIAEDAGDLERAEAYYCLALEHDVADPYLHFAVGRLYRNRGKKQLADTELRKAFEMASQQKDAKLLQALADIGFQAL